MNKKVLSREFAKEYKTQNGQTNYNFKVKFEGDDKTYQYASTVKDNPPHFIPGEMAEFTIEEQKYEKDGTTTIYYKVKPVKPEFKKGGGGYPRKSKADFLVENLSFQSSYVKDLIVSGKVKFEEWEKTLKEMLAFSEAKIKEYTADNAPIS